MTVIQFKTDSESNIEHLIEQLQSVQDEYGLKSLCIVGACKDGEILQGYWTEAPFQMMGLLNSMQNKIDSDFNG